MNSSELTKSDLIIAIKYKDKDLQSIFIQKIPKISIQLHQVIEQTISWILIGDTTMTLLDKFECLLFLKDILLTGQFKFIDKLDRAIYNHLAEIAEYKIQAKDITQRYMFFIEKQHYANTPANRQLCQKYYNLVLEIIKCFGHDLQSDLKSISRSKFTQIYQKLSKYNIFLNKKEEYIKEQDKKKYFSNLLKIKNRDQTDRSYSTIEMDDSLKLPLQSQRSFLNKTSQIKLLQRTKKQKSIIHDGRFSVPTQNAPPQRQQQYSAVFELPKDLLQASNIMSNRQDLLKQLELKDKEIMNLKKTHEQQLAKLRESFFNPKNTQLQSLIVQEYSKLKQKKAIVNSKIESFAKLYQYIFERPIQQEHQNFGTAKFLNEPSKIIENQQLNQQLQNKKPIKSSQLTTQNNNQSKKELLTNPSQMHQKQINTGLPSILAQLQLRNTHDQEKYQKKQRILSNNFQYQTPQKESNHESCNTKSIKEDSNKLGNFSFLRERINQRYMEIIEDQQKNLETGRSENKNQFVDIPPISKLSKEEQSSGVKDEVTTEKKVRNMQQLRIVVPKIKINYIKHNRGPIFSPIKLKQLVENVENKSYNNENIN